jgi:hypothetical protein
MSWSPEDGWDANEALFFGRNPKPNWIIDQFGCWLWTKGTNANGKPTVKWVSQGKKVGVQVGRLMYQNANNSLIPEYTILIQECRVPRCVNPEHQKPVRRRVSVHHYETQPAENTEKTSCDYGHVLDEENTYLYTDKKGIRHRWCRICGRRRTKEYKARQKARKQSQVTDLTPQPTKLPFEGTPISDEEYAMWHHEWLLNQQ